MVFSRIQRIRNPHHRRAVYGIVSLHGLFVSLVALKTLVFNIAGLKALAYGSVFAMSIFNIVPHITLAAGSDPIDYSISNSVYPMFTAQGEMGVYMIYYQNDGDIVGSNVTVTASIPAGMTYYSHQGPAYTSLTPTQITWNMPSGSSAQNGMIILRLLVQPGSSGLLKTTATVSSANPDPEPSNNTSDAVIIANGGVAGDVDLAVTSSTTNSTASMFDDIPITINYINNGLQTATAAKVYELLPPELYLISTSVPYTTKDKNLYTWDVGDVAPGQGGSITVTASLMSDTAQIVNRAIVSSSMIEYETDNNTSELVIDVENAEPSMYVDVIAPKQTICVDENLKFTINLGNNGLGDATAVAVKHTKPSTLTYVSSSKTPTTPSVGVYKWNYSTPFTLGDTASFTVTLKGYEPVVNETIPFIVYNNDVQVASTSIAVTVLPSEMCGDTEGTGGTGGGGGDGTDTAVYGCTDPLAINYNIAANVNNGTCTYSKANTIYGCTHSYASNYNPAATVDNGTCTYTNAVYGCTNKLATNYNSKATIDNGHCILPAIEKTGTVAGTGTKGDGDPKIEPAPKTDLILGKPSKINFFITTPSPKKVPKKTTKEVKKLTETVVVPKTQADIQREKATEADLLKSVTCEVTMTDIYNYAKEKGLIDKYDIPDLCTQVTRIKLAGVMVRYVLDLALVEPKLDRNCSFNDLAGLTNTEKFNASLVCDFGIMGVNADGSVNRSFRPNDPVTKAELATIVSNFMFGDTLKKAFEGQLRYEPSMKALYDAYVIKTTTDPDRLVLLGEALKVLMKVDFGELIRQTKYIRLRDKEKK